MGLIGYGVTTSMEFIGVLFSRVQHVPIIF